MFSEGKNHAARLGENPFSFYYTLDLVVPSPAARAAIAVCCDSLVAHPTSLVVHEPYNQASNYVFPVVLGSVPGLHAFWGPTRGRRGRANAGPVLWVMNAVFEATRASIDHHEHHRLSAQAAASMRHGPWATWGR